MLKIKKKSCRLKKGQIFGKLRILERLENSEKENGWIVDNYLVMCSCGCCFPVSGPIITSGFTDRCNYCKGIWERCS